MSLAAAILIPITILGIAALFRGRKRRVGTDPHCRHCNYILHRLASERCPECGAMLKPAAIVYGEPVRRIASLIFGWLLLLGLAALIALDGLSAIEHFDWYQHEPAYFVLRDLNSSVARTREKACTELIRRDSAGLLRPDQRDQLLLFALNLQSNAAAPFTPLDNTAIAYLGTRLAAGDLTADQRKKICEQSAIVQLSVRPNVIVGDPVPYVFARSGRGPNNLSIRLTVQSCAIDRKALPGWGGISESCSVGGVGSTGSSVPCPAVGKHELELTSRIEFYAGAITGGAAFSSGPPLDTMDPIFRASFEVLSKENGPKVLKVFDPKLAPAMRAAISVDSFSYSVSNRWIQGTVHFKNVPVNVAFDVIARYNGARHFLSSTTANANSGLWANGVMGTDNPPPPATIDIVLVSSEKAATNTVNMVNYWNEEFDFANVPVTRSK
jgi:hypothetical protein